MINHSTLIRHILFAVVLCLSFLSVSAYAQTTAFTYQGRLTDNGNPADSFYDFEFRLFDALTDGMQKGTTLTRTAVEVTNGTFSVQLEFVGCEDCFDGGARFLEISVRPAGGGSYMQLLPRQPLTSTPYAIKALDAARLGGQLATDFIQNTTTQQTMTNFNIAGTGRATIFDAATHISINGLRMLSASGPFNSLGLAASNTFVGESAGINTTPDVALDSIVGKFNSFFGANAGRANTDGDGNSFFGTLAGLSNTTGSDNSFFGREAGSSNTTGGGNSFFGIEAGALNTDGGNNSFFGRAAGLSNTNGVNNSFFGTLAGYSNTTGRENSFFGVSAGVSNGEGFNNTIIGSFANVGATNLTNATAIGTYAVVAQSNSLVLGSISGVNGASADTLVGIGTTAPNFKLTVLDSSNTGLRVATATTGGTVASFGSNGAFEIDSPGFAGGRLRVAENGSVTIGRESVGGDLTVFGNTLLNIVTIANGATLNVLGAAGSTSLCRNASAQISFCSSSIRYKQNIHAFASGLSLINRLRPVTFNWKRNNEPDLGFVAEEVAKVEPLLVTHNGKGEIEGVKYDRVGVVLINAVKEQQAQIEKQQQIIERQQQLFIQQQQQIDALKKLVCASNREAEACK